MADNGSGTQTNLTTPGQNRTPSVATTCLGITYYSTKTHITNGGPICNGWRSTSQDTQQEKLPVDSMEVPSAEEFKYCCVGYAAWQQSQQASPQTATSQTAASQSNRVSTGPPTLRFPYCEGLEVIQSAQSQAQPALLAPSSDEGATPSAAPETNPQPRRDPWTSNMGSTHEPSPEDGTEVERFIERFATASIRISSKMVSLASQMADAVFKGVDDDDGSGNSGR